MTNLFKAIALALTYHGGQLDKGGQLYILHPFRVMQEFTDEQLQIAAVLHDTVEDTKLTLEAIREMFGDRIAEIVDALSRREGEKYKDFTIRCGADRDARMIKLMDLKDNLDPRRHVPSMEGIQKRYYTSMKYLVEKSLEDSKDREFNLFIHQKGLITMLYNNNYTVDNINYGGFVNV